MRGRQSEPSALETLGHSGGDRHGGLLRSTRSRSGRPGWEAHPTEEDLALINDLPGDGVAVWSVDAAGAVRGLIEA